jgi:hypothetical protein
VDGEIAADEEGAAGSGGWTLRVHDEFDAKGRADTGQSRAVDLA